jgi:hypothetical protein
MPDINEGFSASRFRTSPVRASTYALIELLRANITSVQKRVYPPGIRQDSQMPRITVFQLTPTEIRLGIGERYGSGKGLWRICTFKIDCWDKNPTACEETADRVMRTIWDNRYYKTANVPYGFFINLETAGGSETILNPGLQIYQKTVNVRGRWLETTVPA